MAEDILYEFECAECGLLDTINWEPKKPDGLLCVNCHRKRGDKPRYDMSKVANSPRKKHGTRVAFPIECVECGKKETLDHVPKSVPLTELKCSECLQKSLPDHAKHDQVAAIKDEESGIEEWTAECAQCGGDAVLPFRPKPGRVYRCRNCLTGEGAEVETPPEEPVVEYEHEEIADGVFKRKKKT